MHDWISIGSFSLLYTVMNLFFSHQDELQEIVNQSKVKNALTCDTLSQQKRVQSNVQNLRELFNFNKIQPIAVNFVSLSHISGVLNF